MKKWLLILSVLFATNPLFPDIVDFLKTTRTDQQLLVDMLEFLKPVDVLGAQKIRCGPNHDGGYILIDNLEYDAFYSYGIGNQIQFEEAFLQMDKHKHLTCHCFDHTIGSLPKGNHDRLHFTREGIGPTTTSSLDTIENHMKQNGDHGAKNAFLQIDVEGAEWESFLHMPDAVLQQFKQIVIELHGLGEDTWGADMPTKVAVLGRLSHFFHVAHIHTNNSASVKYIRLKQGHAILPLVLEVTYLRKDPEIIIGASTSDYPIRGLDYKNAPSCRLVHLNAYPFQAVEAR